MSAGDGMPAADGMTLAEALAGFVVKTDAAGIPPTAWVGAAAAVGDCLACMLAGSLSEAAGIVRSVVEARGGRRAATLVGRGGRASAADAPLVNGVAGHALDYDDINWTLYGHPSVVVLPAALAVAETAGRSGRDLLTAYLIGVEVVP